MGESTRSPCRNRSPLRHAMAILAIFAVLTGGMLLRQSGLANSVVESAIYSPIVSEAPPPDYIIQVIDERGQPVPSFQIMIQTAARGSTMWTTGAGGLVTLGGYQSTQYRDQWAIDALGQEPTGTQESSPVSSARTERRYLREKRLSPCNSVRRLRFASDFRKACVCLPTSRQRFIFRAIETHSASCGIPITDARTRATCLTSISSTSNGPLGGRFAFRIDRTSGPFYVAVHHPGFLQFLLKASH